MSSVSKISSIISTWNKRPSENLQSSASASIASFHLSLCAKWNGESIVTQVINAVIIIIFSYHPENQICSVVEEGWDKTALFFQLLKLLHSQPHKRESAALLEEQKTYQTNKSFDKHTNNIDFFYILQCWKSWVIVSFVLRHLQCFLEISNTDYQYTHSYFQMSWRRIMTNLTNGVCNTACYAGILSLLTNERVSTLKYWAASSGFRKTTNYIRRDY